MSDETTPVNYQAMYTPDGTPVEPTPEPQPVDAEGVLVPTPEPTPDPTPDPTPEPSDLSATGFVSVNIDSVGKLRLRAEASVDSDIVTKLVSGTVLKVINSDNPEWTLVETLDGQVGYVKSIFVIEAPAPDPE